MKEAPHAVKLSGSEVKFADEMLMNKAFRNETIEHIGKSDPKLAKDLHAKIGKASPKELKEAAIMARLDEALKRHPLRFQGEMDRAQTTRIVKDITSKAYQAANAVPAQSEASFVKKFVDAAKKEVKEKRDWKFADGKFTITPPLQIGKKISFCEVPITAIGKELLHIGIPTGVAIGYSQQGSAK